MSFHRASLLLIGLLWFATAGFAVGGEVMWISLKSNWRFLAGRAEASSPDPRSWRGVTFDDGSWLERPAVFYYGESGFTGTHLADMQGNYSSFFLRKNFVVADPGVVSQVYLRAICDDGYVAWINGQPVASVYAPAGGTNYNSLASGVAQEPVTYVTQVLPAPSGYLVPGTNVLAIQVFNVSIGSSDIVFDAELVAELRSDAPPSVASVVPAPGLVDSLTRVTVTFSEAVVGVKSSDLMLNEVGAIEVSGGGQVYAFEFEPPPLGGVQVTWDSRNAIRTVALPTRGLDSTGPGMNWAYELVSPTGPVVEGVHPPAGLTLGSLTEVSVTFDQAVMGLEAQDLELNGTGAMAVTGLGAGPYRFQFGSAAAGSAVVGWAADHGITGVSVYAPELVAAGWSYTVEPQVEPPVVMINELLAESVEGLTDEDGANVDWIELHNAGTSAVSLHGWGLTDDLARPHQWVFPEVNLPARGYLVVFASGKDRRSTASGSPLHTNFKLGVEGEYLGLFSPDTPARAVSELAPGYGEQRPGYGYGRQPGGVWGYYAQPTPGSANGSSSITNVVSKVHFNVGRCTFNRPFDLWLSCPTPGATVRYTTDGSTPTEISGQAYGGPLRLQRSVVVRAAAFKPRHLPSVVQTHTYIYFPSTRLRSAPVISLTTDASHLYGTSGIMEYSPRNTTKQGIAWERPVSFEYLTPDGAGSFQVDCGIRVAGGGYVRERYNYNSSELPWNKYSFRLYFRGDYGPGRLRYPLFPDTTVDNFDTITLRAGMNDHSNPLLRDEMVRQLAADVGQVSSRGTFVTVLLNGRSVGVYNPCERIDVDFLRTYHGGTNDWDLLGSNSELLDGDTIEWNRLRTFINTRDLAEPGNYLEAGRQLDLVNFVDYLLPQIYADNDDWPYNNWRAARERVPGSRFRFYVWDAEWAFGYQGHSPSHNTIANQLSSTSPPWGSTDIQRIFNGLKLSPEFRLLFADRVHRHLFNGGALTDERVRARYEQVKARVLPMISGFNDSIGTVWIPQRRSHLLNHLAAAGFLASANAPVFNQFGGRVPSGWELELAATRGEIYFTTDGTDPRVLFSGAIGPTATRFTTPVRLDETMLVKARTLDGTTWSALTEALFEVARVGSGLEFSEIMYNPPGGDAYEFIEFLNSGSVAVDLGGFTMDGVDYRFPVGAALFEAGARIVLVSGREPAAFALRYPEVIVAGYFEGSLSNGGERLALRDAQGATVTAVTYGDAPPWPVSADGEGASLERVRFDGDPDDPASWQASAVLGGSPGKVNGPELVPDIVLNEMMAVNRSAVPRGERFPDWIELHNRGGAAVDLGGWSLSDNEDPRRFTFPAATILSEGGYLMVWCEAEAGGGGLQTGFGLEKRGETVALYDPSGARVDVVTFGPQVEDYSIGRMGTRGEWRLTEPTPGAPNELALVGSAHDLVINEFLANAAVGGADWLELYNRNEERPVALAGLHIATENNQYQNRALGFVGAGGYVVWIADGEAGPDHVGLRLPAGGGDLIVRDATGAEVDRLEYAAQAEAVSFGRLPDGSATWSAFPGTASPGAANYVQDWTGPILNEFMARNRNTMADPSGRSSDWLELYNPGGAPFDLGGMSLNVRENKAGAWFFPAGSVIGAGEYLLVWCSDATAGSTVFSADMNVGAPIRGEGGGIYLYSVAGQLVDSVAYGFQVEDRSVGRTGQGWGLMAQPTPGGENGILAELGDYRGIRFNEWLAAGAAEDDWFELYNPAELPVELSGLYLTDDPGIASQTKHPIGPLTFMAARGFVKWVADGQPQAGPDHVNFSLNAMGEMIRLNTNAMHMVDVLYLAPQMSGVSEGRLPDGDERIVRFPHSATPGRANYLPLPNLVISEVLSHTDPPLEDAIEVQNLGPQAVDLGGWYLSNQEAMGYRVPMGTMVPAGGYHVFYEYQFNARPGMPDSFALSSAYGDTVNLFETDATGQSTGRRATATFGPAANGVSFGRIPTSQGVDYAALVGRTLGVDQPTSVAEFRTGKGGLNAMVLVGPVVINELMYHPPVEAGIANELESGFEYVELANVGSGELALFDPEHPANRWRLGGGIEYTFPAGMRLTGDGVVLVVGFDPTARPDLASAFREKYEVPNGVPVLGPYGGALSNAGERIELLRPDRPQGAQQPDAGYVPYLVVDAVAYADDWPWPPAADGAGASLQRQSPHLHGNEPLHWKAAPPTAGRSNVDPLDLDSDQDGMPDRWEEAHGLDPQNRLDAGWDADGDGQSNLAEYLAGTDPRDPEDVLELGFEMGDRLQRLKFWAQPGRSYSVQYCDDLTWGVWLRAADVDPAEDIREIWVEVEEWPDENQRLYRVVMPAQP